MNREFCTLFDVNYLPRGLVLHHSLQRVCPGARLRVFCMDAATKSVLDRLALPGLTAIGLDELEAHDPALAAVKPTRTQVEYCWTATPAICLAALDREPELEAITYLDADLMFFADPGELFDELGDASVLITPHRYAPRWQHHEARMGTYNVQFLTFRRDEHGLAALRWWRERCLEWCYARVEDGKMGDQAYLNDWPTRFEGVHVLQHPGGGLAPWNVETHTLEQRGGRVEVDGRTLVFFHYHGLTLHRGRGIGTLARLPNPYRPAPSVVWRSHYPVTPLERRLLWEPYVAGLAAAQGEAARGGAPAAAGVRLTSPPVLLEATARRLLPDRAQRLAGEARRAVRQAREGRGAYRDSWKSAAVVAQHRELVLAQLERPDTVAVYRTFTTAIEALLAGGPLPDPARLLDLGCGLGHYGELLDRRFPGRFAYTGCDYAPEMVEEARREWPGREFIVGDLLNGSLDLDAYDVVCASALIDVLEDYDAGLDRLLGSAAPHVLLHRQRITEGPSRSEPAPGYAGQTTYRSYLSLRDLERAAGRHGRRIARSFDVEGDIKSFLIERAA